MNKKTRNRAGLLRFVGYVAVAIGYSALITACSTATEDSTAVDQDKIFQAYTASYDQATNQTTVMAQFRFGDGSGTTLQLKDKSHVSHDTLSLTEQNIFGTFYGGNTPGFQAKHTFHFVDTQGKEFVNSGTIPTIALPDSTPKELKQSASANLTWEGAPLAQGETVTVIIQNPANLQEEIYVFTSNVGSTFVTITPSDLAKLTKGEKTIQWKREKSVPIAQGTQRGGNFLTTYTTVTKPIRIIE